MKKLFILFMMIAFLVSLRGSLPVYGEILPKLATRVDLSPAFNPPILKGIKVHPEDPFKFEFVLDLGDKRLSASERDSHFKAEANKLIKYFLAALTVPEEDLWVNLSPYEKDRIVPEAFGQTEMGRDLLAQDYLLKQITASLMFPEGEIGKKFWKKIYEESAKRFGNTNVPVNTFNKVWIVPEKAVVYENSKNCTASARGGCAYGAYVVESKLKVMLEEDYLAIKRNLSQPGDMTLVVSPSPLPSKKALKVEATQVNPRMPTEPTTTASQIIKASEASLLSKSVLQEIILPELTKEINEGQNFAQLRQVYNSLILATWYKRALKGSFVDTIYVDKNKVQGVNINDPDEKNKIYQRYLQAFKKGAYNLIKDTEMPDGTSVPRKYFSGGFSMGATAGILNTIPVLGSSIENEAMIIDVILKTIPPRREVSRRGFVAGVAAAFAVNSAFGQGLSDPKIIIKESKVPNMTEAAGIMDFFELNKDLFYSMFYAHRMRIVEHQLTIGAAMKSIRLDYDPILNISRDKSDKVVDAKVFKDSFRFNVKEGALILKIAGESHIIRLADFLKPFTVEDVKRSKYVKKENENNVQALLNKAEQAGYVSKFSEGNAVRYRLTLKYVMNNLPLYSNLTGPASSGVQQFLLDAMVIKKLYVPNTRLSQEEEGILKAAFINERLGKKEEPDNPVIVRGPDEVIIDISALRLNPQIFPAPWSLSSVLMKLIIVVNQAMLVEENRSNTGGIDLTSDKALLVQNNGQEIRFSMDPAQIHAVSDISGLSPEIHALRYTNNVKVFLEAPQAN